MINNYQNETLTVQKISDLNWILSDEIIRPHFFREKEFYGLVTFYLITIRWNHHMLNMQS